MARTLKVAVQMDPIESINIDADSTFALMLEAQRRGHTLWHYEVRHLALREGVKRQGEHREDRLFARARPVTVERKRVATRCSITKCATCGCARALSSRAPGERSGYSRAYGR